MEQGNRSWVIFTLQQSTCRYIALVVGQLRSCNVLRSNVGIDKQGGSNVLSYSLIVACPGGRGQHGSARGCGLEGAVRHYKFGRSPRLPAMQNCEHCPLSTLENESCFQGQPVYSAVVAFCRVVLTGATCISAGQVLGLGLAQKGACTRRRHPGAGNGCDCVKAHPTSSSLRQAARQADAPVFRMGQLALPFKSHVPRTQPPTPPTWELLE